MSTSTKNKEDTNHNEHDKRKEKELDQAAKLQLLIRYLEGYCNDKSEHDDLRKLGKAIQNGAKLTGTVISGGYTNYSYKIHLDSAAGSKSVYDKDLAVFAKIAFPYALWAPSKDDHYNLSRVKEEFDLMTRFSEELKFTTENEGKTKSPIPKPYVLIDIPASTDGESPNMKIFVAEWVAPTDEQWGNQFIEGEVDNRVIDRCAKTLANINLADCDENVNEGFVHSMEKISAGLVPLFLELSERDNDKAVIYARDVLGPEKMKAIINKFYVVSNKTKDAFVHGDAHVFNMLVERKPDVSQLSKFGPEGDFFLCDWEMAHMGPKGQDVSNFISFPFMSACFLAARGHSDKSDGILRSLKHFWTTYKATLVKGLRKKNAERNSEDTIDIDQYLSEVLHSAIGFFGFFSIIAFYLLGCFIEFFETEGLTEEEKKTVMGAVGWTGLRSMEVGYLEASAEQVFGDHGDQRLSRMESFFFGMIEKEVKQLSVSLRDSRRRSRRRSSMLRESSHRVSDIESGFGKVVRRLSSQIMVEEY